MNALRRAWPALSNAHAQFVACALVVVWSLVVATFIVPGLVVGHALLSPARAVAVTGLSGVIALTALFPRRLSPSRRRVNRAVGHGTLTALVMAAYAATVSGMTALLDDYAGIEIALGAAGLVALIVQPLRAVVERPIDRLLFGRGGDPYRVITQLGRRLETTALPEDLLPGVVDTVADALHLPYVAIELESQTGRVVAASTGTCNGATTRLPLVHQAEQIGWLVLGARAPGERLRAADLRLLEDLACQIGVAARAVQLMHDLERSRALLVVARDEERRRLQRNLHDGLGPMLAGINLAAQAAHNLVGSKPQEADSLLARVIAESRSATDDVRRLVYDLRPPALDRLGLVQALREQVTRLRSPGDGDGDGDGGSAPAVTIEAPDHLGALPPAVELAAFRIALEAFVNVQRHADARSCTIRLALDAALHVDVIDDGVGIEPLALEGVGITSMRDRALELGGSCSVGPADGGGTAVHAVLPVSSLWSTPPMALRSAPAGRDAISRPPGTSAP